MSVYIHKLNRELARAAEPEPAAKLSQRLIDWHQSLPAVSRMRRFSMSEIEKAMTTQGRYIGQELLSLGWRRKRVWSTSGSYSRYWVPPNYTG